MTTADEKREAMETAIREYLAERSDGAYLIDFVVFAAGVDPKGRGCQYGFWVSPESNLHSIKGLVELGQEEIYEGSYCIDVDADDE